MSIFLFYLFSALALILAVAVVTTRRILRAAVYLMGVLGLTGAFYGMLEAEFLAGIQILVYVGGIVVLLVFAIMLTRSSELLEDVPSFSRKLLGFFAAASTFVLMMIVFAATNFSVLKQGARIQDDTAEIGRRLLDAGSKGYVLPFEILSLLLLSALIGGIVLARKVLPQEGEN